MTAHGDYGVPEPAITIAIPVYAGTDYLRKAIDSVFRQTDPRWELLICDDASPDPGVSDLVASYQSPRVRYTRSDRNLGMVANWNRCLELARTDLVVLLHEDDELLDGYCRLMLCTARKYPEVGFFFCGARIIDEAGKACFSFPDYIKRFFIPKGRGPIHLSGQAGLVAILRGNFIMCPTVCYRKSFLGDNLFSGQWKQAQDLALFASLLAEGRTILGLRQQAYAYRRHGKNATALQTASMLRFEEEIRLFDSLAGALCRPGWRWARRVARAKAIVKWNLAYCALMDLFRGRWLQASRKACVLRSLFV
jgi:glycosyltransferase involved in cell wall biosynthesis